METAKELFDWIRTQGAPVSEHDAEFITYGIYLRGLIHGRQEMTDNANQWRECFNLATDSVSELQQEVFALKAEIEQYKFALSGSL